MREPRDDPQQVAPPGARRALVWRRYVGFWGARVDADVDDELAFHVDMLVREYRARGMSESAARAAARARVGNIGDARNACLAIGYRRQRRMTRAYTLDALRRDLAFAARTLGRAKAWTAVAIVTLGLGIGATTTMLSVVNGVLLRPLPYADASRLTVILHDGSNPVAPANFVDWRRQTRSFTDLAAAEYWTPTFDASGAPTQIDALHVTANMFTLLGVPPLLGRGFAAGDDRPGNEHVAVIGYGFWQRQFAGDPRVIGRTVALDGTPFTIVGVMPRSFQFAPFWATRAELWAPLVLAPRLAAGDRTGNSLRVFARLTPGVTLAEARAEVAAVTGRLEREYPGTNRDVVVVPLEEKVVGNVRTPLLVLLGAVAFVLLIACANVAHMLLARAGSRRRELAVRTALGATQARLMTQLLVESGLLSLLGGIVGIVVAFWGVHALTVAQPMMIPRVARVAIDGRVLLMTLGVTLMTAAFFGAAPAVDAVRVDLTESLKDGSRGASGGRRGTQRRRLLVASEFALALVLLASAGLMLRSFVALEHIDPGFDPAHVVTMRVATTGTRAADSTVHAAFYVDALARVRALPGVASASYINHLPIAGDVWGLPFTVEGQPAPRPGEAPTAVYRVVFPGYFHTMRIPLLRGRTFTDADREGAPPVVVINQFMAERYWPGQSAIGQRIAVDDSTWVTVVGVARNDVRHDWDAPPEPEIFLPFFQQPGYVAGAGTRASMTLVARVACGRGACDAAAMAAPIARAVRGTISNIPISDIETMSSVVAQAEAEPRFYARLFAAFAALAVVLAAVGIYGVMSYAVSRRAREIGVRLALGAAPASVLWLIVGEGLLVAGGGAAVGLVLAAALTRLMRGLLYGVSPADPATFVAVTVGLSLVAFGATAGPAWRAMRIDPATALRGP